MEYITYGVTVVTKSWGQVGEYTGGMWLHRVGVISVTLCFRPHPSSLLFFTRLLFTDSATPVHYFDL
jgi:hypothetical protein